MGNDILTEVDAKTLFENMVGLPSEIIPYGSIRKYVWAARYKSEGLDGWLGVPANLSCWMPNLRDVKSVRGSIEYGGVLPGAPSRAPLIDCCPGLSGGPDYWFVVNERGKEGLKTKLIWPVLEDERRINAMGYFQSMGGQIVPIRIFKI
jgi:hypothetical protein|tara:strand:+ start:684 stop:1130 length:447 start_codon:yes stop_codon:yes gene_type:complete